MTKEELTAWLSLYFTPRIGPKTFQRLVAVDSPINIIDSSPETLRRLGFSNSQLDYLQHRAVEDIEACFEWQAASSARTILPLSDQRYPALLKQADAAPATLFVEGQLESLSRPQMAIVGSRNASIDGLNTARSFATQLVNQDMVVTSGLALGVDGYAHDGALNGNGQTIAVLGCGLNTVYPARHKKLAQRIVEQGALVSEFHPNVKPKADNFPRRNRIISGLSLGVLVIEAAEKSGSLITARYAMEQGREVFAIPGSIHHPHARGCNLLIKQGACLVQQVSDITDEIDSLIRWSDVNKPPVQSDLFEQIDCKEELPFPQLLANVGSKATPVDILASRTNIPVHEVMMQLLELELSGHVVAVSGGYIRKGRG
ncbi:DNA-processing protein DprA [Vibrio coralliilyticus]|uniref:DNA-processing protein DprA n=1 Tax=Vibrio coralliilyticus TaxID=190893 RepID=UPI000BAAB3E2|nr:DNA-processing protein DprA [Vibrio coralliilyticus]NOI60796.1 DNA-protecting protein DprA [Vibrio coralliilyticus]PAT65326.1 DNA-protecting protein DprA [Vibrio coralliilyticus]